MQNELSIDVQLGTIAAQYRKLASMDVHEMVGVDNLTSREVNILIENRTGELLRELAMSLINEVEMRRKYA
jgi:flagellar motor switch/type III secretory pathway protein FliN